MDVVWKVTVVKQRREFSEPDLEPQCFITRLWKHNNTIMF